MKNPHLICYDFDGTLCNTLPDIAASMNAVFRHYGFDGISEERVRDFIGSGITKLVERSVFHVMSGHDETTVPPEKIMEITKAMAVHYSAHLTDRSHLYPGVIDILEHFSGTRQIVVSNKPEMMVRDMLAHYGIGHYFDLVVGGDTLDVCKPDPGVWQFIKKTLALPGKLRGVMVGDSVPDVRFGKIAGLLTVAVSYGYNDVPRLIEEGADAIIDSLTDLIAVC